MYVKRMSTPVEVARVFHERVQQMNTSLGVVKSRLNGRVSSHVFADKTSFSTMIAFQKIAQSEKCHEKTHIGTIAGELCLSVNAAYKPVPPETTSRKRKADVELDEAERAVAKVKKSGEGADKVSDESYKIATNSIASLLKLTGASKEPCLEAWAISLRKQGEWGAAPSSDGRPSLVVAARLTGGIAIQLSSVLSAFRNCRDGMVSISTDAVNKDFNLPKTEQCIEADQQGQRSMLFLASVPHVDA